MSTEQTPEQTQTTTVSQTQQQKNCTIYIGNIDEALDEMSLGIIFHRFGQIKSFQLKKDNYTNQSKGYCFIEFSNEESAQKAIQEANGMQIGNKHIRVVQLSNPREFKAEANLYMSKLDKDLTNSDLQNYFQQFGKVLSIQISTDQTNQHLGYGYIQFENEEDANKVIQNSNHTIKDKLVEIQKFVSRKERDGQREKRTIYVTNIQQGDNQSEKIKELFSQHGKVEKVVVDKEEQGKLYAFVDFENQQQAEKAIAAVNNTDPLNQGVLSVSWPVNKDDRENDSNERNLYSRNIKLSVKEEEIKKIFEQEFGKIIQIKLSEEKPNPRNPYAQANANATPASQFAYIYFENKSDAKKAQVQAYGNKNVQQLYVNESVFINILMPKEQRRAFVDSTKKMLNPGSNPYVQKPVGMPFGMPMMPQQTFMPQYNQQFMMGPQFYQQQPFVGGNQYPYKKKQFYNNNNNNQNQRPNQRKQNNFKPRVYNRDNNNQATTQNKDRETEDLITKLENKANLGEKEKQEVWKYLGTQIFPKVQNQVGARASKITGMLVDLETYTIRDIVETINNPETLNSQIKEAVKLLDEAEKQQQ